MANPLYTFYLYNLYYVAISNGAWRCIIWGMITLKSCPVCDSQLFTLYQTVAGGGLIYEIMPGVNVEAAVISRYSQCNDCHLVFQNPRLTDEELGMYYGSDYYRSNVNPPPEGMDRGEEIRAEVDSEIINKYLGEVHSHLDIGCGLGYLLNKINADVKVGVESNLEYVKFKDIILFNNFEKVTPNKFELVTSIHSLEHVSNPLDYLKSMVKLVDKKGHLVVEVPSSKSRGGPLGFAALYYYEPEVLKKICEKVGSEVLHEEFTPHLVLICKPSI